MTKSLIICKLIFKIWQRSLAKILNTKSKVVGVISFLIFIIALSIIAGYCVVNPIIVMFVNGDTRSLYLLFSGILVNISVVTTALFVLVKSVIQERGEFEMQLNWFPLTTFQRNLGYKLPIFFVVFVSELFINTLLVVPSLVMNDLQVGFLLASILAFIIQITFVFFLNTIIYDFCIFIISMIGLPYRKLITLLILLMSVFYYFIENFSVEGILSSYTKFDYNILYLISGVLMKSVKVVAFNSVSYLRISIYILITAFLALSTLFCYEKVQNNNSSKILKFLPMSKGFNRSLIIKEVKVQIRNEENYINIIIFLLLSILVRFKLGNLEPNIMIIGIVSLVSSMLALNSFGNENNYFIMYKANGVELLKVLISKALGLCIIGYGLFLLITIIILGINMDIYQVLISIPIVISSIISLYILGILIPVDNKNPYMGVFAFFILFFTMIPIVVILNQIITTNMSLIIVAVVLTIILFAAFYLVAKWRIKYE